MIVIGLTDYDSPVTMSNDFLCVLTDVEKIGLLFAILYLGELSISMERKTLGDELVKQQRILVIC